MLDLIRGSEWRRWDLHIHTPGTLKNDLYEGASIEEKWKNFYSSINQYIYDTTDTLKTIVAIGVTDYLSIDNYKKIIEDGQLPDCVSLVLPNVEMRIQPHAGDAPLNIHLIFSPNSVADIETRFFSKLSFRYGDTNFNATKPELTRLGRTIGENLSDLEAYKKGVEQFVISFDALREVFDKDMELRNQVIIGVSNSSKDGVSGVVNHNDYLEKNDSQLTAFRQSIYKFCDVIFSANPKDIDYFLGRKEKFPPEVIISECGALKPCIHGSDAHTNSKLFEPDLNRYCWIKADPTFNGLKQIIYEPEERVRIHEHCPENKQGYYVIDQIHFNNSDFQTEPVFFSDKLTCIIGGKSTGKSILLRNLALAIDPEQVKIKEEKSITTTKTVDNVSIYWKDNGDIKGRRIIYIPQTYINKLSDEKEEKTEIDKFIEEIVLLNSTTENMYEQTKNNSKIFQQNTYKNISDLIYIHNDMQKIEFQKKELGDKIGIENEIQKIKGQKDKLSKDLSLTQEEIDSYNQAIELTAHYNNQISSVEREINILGAISTIVEKIDISQYFSEMTLKEINIIMKKMIDSADNLWKNEKEILIKKLKTKKENFAIELKKSINAEQSLAEKIKNNKAMIDLAARLLKENEKIEKIKNFDMQYKELLEKKIVLLKQIVSSKDFFWKQYRLFVDSVDDISNFNQGDLDFFMEIIFRCEAFISKMNEIFDTRSVVFKNTINPDNFEEEKYSDEFLYDVVNKILSKELSLKTNHTIESAIRDIFTDWFNIRYHVKMDGDSISMMSPGKKALVLLKLLIDLAESKCPILIDQPEDDLDNRSIFTQLIPFIKKKKRERQIIIVTHNANIVLGSDAELVIVANQDGKNAQNREFKFEYRSGSIENNTPVKKSDGTLDKGILNKQGIQQHICDVLEGGEKAFNLRKQKYYI